MKKVFLALSAIALAALACCGLAACDKTTSDYNLSYANESAYTVAQDGLCEPILNLDINWHNGAVLIRQSSDISAVAFRETYNQPDVSQKNTMHYLCDGNTLFIKYAASGKQNIGQLQKVLYVDVPPSVALNIIHVSVVSSEVKIHDVNADTVNISNGYRGAVEVDCNANKIDISTKNSSVSVICPDDELRIRNDHGNTAVSIKYASLKRLHIESITGNVAIVLPHSVAFRFKYSVEKDGLFVNKFSSNIKLKDEYCSYLYNPDNPSASFEGEIITHSGTLTLEEPN